MKKIGKMARNHLVLSITLLAFLALGAASLVLLFAGTPGEASEASKDIETSHDRGGPDPWDEGSSILSIGEYAESFDLKAPCWVGYDYTPGAEHVNIIDLGYMWGRLYSTSSKTSSADAFYDGGTGDCGDGDYVGEADNDSALEMYVHFAVAMDSSTSNIGYFQFRIKDVYECTTSCDSGCTSKSTFTDYARTGSAVGDTLFRFGINLNPIWCTTDYNYDSLCFPHVRITPPAQTGDYWYRYTLEVKTCIYGNCSDATTVSDDGCFKIDWVD